MEYRLTASFPAELSSSSPGDSSLTYVTRFATAVDVRVNSWPKEVSRNSFVNFLDFLVAAQNAIMSQF
jgi:hypothetical protein